VLKLKEIIIDNFSILPKNYRKPIALTVKQAKEKFGEDVRGWATLKELNSKKNKT